MDNIDLLLQKQVSIERCLKQVKRYYQSADKATFEQDYLHQDAINLNLQRICELCIDVANITVRSSKLGLPKTSNQSFILLYEASIVDATLLPKLKGMVGFRNVLIHEYTKLDINILIDIIENGLNTPLEFVQQVIAAMSAQT